MPQENAIRLTIEGRVFIQEHPTFEQQFYIMEQATAAGLPDIDKLQLDPKTDSLPKMAQKMLLQAYRSGSLFKLLASLITEEGTEWTPELAMANADFFRKVRDPESQKQMSPAIAGAIVAFFENAASLDWTSLTSLIKPEGGRPATPILTEAQAGAVFASGSMPSLSAKSPSIIDSTPKRSSRGKSAKASSSSR